MRYRNLVRSDPGGGVAFDAPLDLPQTASAKVSALRERAHRYRELAETVYNSDIVAEILALVSELEEQAAASEMASYPFFRVA